MEGAAVGNTLPTMWIPCILFAHSFAAFFLLRMLGVMYPSAWLQLRRLGRGAVSPPRSGELQCGGSSQPKSCQSNKCTPHNQVKRSGVPGSQAQIQLVGQDQAALIDQDHVEDDLEIRIHVKQGSLSCSKDSQTEAFRCKLMALVRPMALEWHNLGCSYNTSVGTKTVLQGVWGRAVPGDMLALLGPSGAGKSTLLDVLAGRKNVGQLTGHVLVNGAPRRKASFLKHTAYVPQEDNFLPTMTVKETCSFYATMLLPRGTSRAMHRERCLEVLAAMGLSHTTDTLVGGTLPGGILLRGLSGGERKRLSIATGIMSAPSVVFLDEPTSGLDSFAALSVMTYMKGMATDGCQTVVSSIHQPRAAIWALFDKVMLLSMGHMMYFGTPAGLVPWFVEGCGYSYDPTVHGLASDWVMDLVNIGFHKPKELYGKTIDRVEQLEAASEAFRARHQAELAADAVKDETAVGQEGRLGARPPALSTISSSMCADSQHKGSLHWLCSKEHDNDNSRSSASWLTQCRVLLWRELLCITRNPADVAGRCMVHAYCGLFNGLVFYNLSTTLDGLRSRINLLYMQPLILTLMPYVYMSLFISDKQYFIADASAKLYRPSAYYVAKQLAVLPFTVLNCLMFSFIMYGLAGLRPEGFAVGMNAAMSMFSSLIATQVLTLAAVVLPNQDLAFMAAIVWTTLNMVLNNFTIRYADMRQQWLSQLRYLSAVGYAFEGYGQAEFKGVTYSCAGGLAPSVVSLLSDLMPNTPAVTSPLVTRTMAQPGPNCVLVMDSILSYFDLFKPFWLICTILATYLGILHIMTFMGLLRVTRQERR